MNDAFNEAPNDAIKIANNDVDLRITLDCLTPPTYQGRVLTWSGEGHIPGPGEAVRVEFDSATMLPGIVVGYFQAHGHLGVKVLLESSDEVCMFGAEIDVATGNATNDVVN